MSMLPYLLAIASSTCFAVASLIFTDISRLISPVWMNAVKAVVAFVLFTITVWILGYDFLLPGPVTLALVMSGVLGLAIGDIFLLTAYARMGSARTLILFGFQPFFLGLAAHYLFQQQMNAMRIVALVFFVLCLFTFSLEKYRHQGHWEIWGLLAALLGVIFDNCGVVLSMWAFQSEPALNAFQANVWRLSGALLFFAVFGFFRTVGWRRGWQDLTGSQRALTLVASFLGTYLSLTLYLTAMKIGHLATLSALGVAGPMISSVLECARERKPPSRYLLVAIGFFLIGFAILIWL